MFHCRLFGPCRMAECLSHLRQRMERHRRDKEKLDDLRCEYRSLVSQYKGAMMDAATNRAKMEMSLMHRA